MSRRLLSLIFYVNLAVVIAILGYRTYIVLTFPDAGALLVRQIERIEAATQSEDSISFAVVGEANNSINVFERQIVPRVNASEADFLVSAGNIVSGGGEDKYRAILGALSHLDKPYLLTFGQNEYEEFGSGRFYQRFGPHFYTVSLGDLRLIFLDSTGRTPIDWQERWLRDVLEGDRPRRIIVFAGHPLVELEQDPLFEPDQGAWSAPEDRGRLLSLLGELGVEMVVSAGAATFSDREVEGIRHVVTGGAGGFVINDDTSFYHYLQLTAGPEGIALDMRRVDTAPTPTARRIEGLWFFIYSLFYVGIWNFLLIFSAFVAVGVYLFNRLFRERQYYPSYDLEPPVDLGRPMRVVMFTNTYLPFIGGVPVSVARLKTGLERQGHEVLVVCPSYGDEAPDPTICRVPALFRSGRMVRLANPLHLATWRRVRDFRPDVAHLHHPFWLGTLGLRMARHFGVPAVFTYHTRLEEYAHVIPLPGRLFRNVIAHWVVRRFANRCDEVIVPTPVTRDYVRLIGVDRPVHVHPTGIEVETYRTPDRAHLSDLAAKWNPEGRRLLVTVARLSQEKNLDFLVAAMAELKRRSAPSFRLLIIGEGEERPHLEALIRETGLEAEVKLVGSVPATEVPAFLNLADVFVFASVSETQGMVVLEAMAAGLPVVAVNSSGIDAFVENGRTGIVTAENVEVWTDALHALLVNRSQRDSMARAGEEAAQRHSVERFSEDIVALYRAALGKCRQVKDRAGRG